MRIVMIAVAVCLFTAGIAWAFSPFTSSPDIVEVKPDEPCRKEPGRLKCRWGGSCTKIGNACYSCIEGHTYHTGLGKCYSCPSGTSLQQVQGAWECK